MKLAGLYLFAIMLAALKVEGQAAAEKPAEGLLQVKRIYVAQLTGGPQADALRELLVASIAGDKLFVLTDNPERADATLKGAADDHVFDDTFDSSEGISGRASGTAYSSGSSSSSSKGSYTGLGSSIGDNEAHHIKERKHEAYAAVRLCNKDGDVIWSTTQESLGAKFRGASADVAARVAHQLALDVERARRAAAVPNVGNAIAPR